MKKGQPPAPPFQERSSVVSVNHPARRTPLPSMHELSIAQNILEAASRQARDRGFQRILSIHLRVGKLSGIEVESLRFCFKVLSEETIAQSAGLEVEVVPLRGRCRCCQSEFAMEEVDFVCPRCHNRDIELISGTEMLMDKMEVE